MMLPKAYHDAGGGILMAQLMACRVILEVCRQVGSGYKATEVVRSDSLCQALKFFSELLNNKSLIPNLST